MLLCSRDSRGGARGELLLNLFRSAVGLFELMSSVHLVVLPGLVGVLNAIQLLDALDLKELEVVELRHLCKPGALLPLFFRCLLDACLEVLLLFSHNISAITHVTCSRHATIENWPDTQQ